jgi:hypothetical protein
MNGCCRAAINSAEIMSSEFRDGNGFSRNQLRFFDRATATSQQQRQ